MRETRDKLIQAVQHGQITPDQAEAEVVRLGLEPFASEPDPACFDPLRETFWTPAMAVAWIALRTLDAVREWWNAYRAECRDWQFRRWRVGPEGLIHEGHFLEQRRPAALMDIRLAEIWDQQAGEDIAPVITIPDAIDALWIALREGLFDATALPPEGGPRKPVPAAQWHDLKPYDDGNDQIAAHLFGAHRIEYREVLVPSAAVVGLWRARTPDVAHGLPEVVKPEGAGYSPCITRPNGSRRRAEPSPSTRTASTLGGRPMPISRPVSLQATYTSPGSQAGSGNRSRATASRTAGSITPSAIHRPTSSWGPSCACARSRTSTTSTGAAASTIRCGTGTASGGRG